MTTHPTSPSNAGSPAFATTHWTRVLEARGESLEAQAALSDLCASYYQPVFAFIRRGSRDDDSARDLAQEFFARILARHGIDSVNPQLGRFRSFILGAVKHFLADMHDRAATIKRGSGQRIESLDASTDTSPGLQIEDPTLPGPEQEFDRKWALTVLDRALAALAREHHDAGKSLEFETLKPWLTGDTDNLSQAGAAQQLASNEGAVKVAIHRLRRRFRECVKEEIARTLKDKSQVQGELSCLLQALSH